VDLKNLVSVCVCQYFVFVFLTQFVVFFMKKKDYNNREVIEKQVMSSEDVGPVPNISTQV